MNIILYGSRYGTAQRYAKELSKRTNINAVSFENVQDINMYDEIIYIGSLYAGSVLGLAKTFKKIKDASGKTIILVTIGLSDPLDDKNIHTIEKNIHNQIPNEIFKSIKKIFHFRGAIDYNKLSFGHKTMMKLLYNTIKNKPKEALTAVDRAIIETYNKKVDFTNFQDLEKIICEM
ncbi:MAG: flavodoxin domain-containing protein [Faecalicoccus sp.]|uniref:flavodoxin domain-containing protein n=1 Tax=Faecalicoccus sp. TaxID=1971758 RepID=UPI002A90F68B|nr:flavodoxin domain-containing protein [Faecalicoccus sp.]MDY5233617.1 flavodoxin domain-containing protein [Faecalicoccus sp.]